MNHANLLWKSVLCSMVLAFSSTQIFAAEVEFSSIDQAKVENRGCDELGDAAPLIFTASNDQWEVDANGIVRTTIEFNPVDERISFQRFTKYSNTNGSGTFRSKAQEVPKKYVEAGKVIATVKFGVSGTYQHVIALRMGGCESRVTLPTIKVR